MNKKPDSTNAIAFFDLDGTIIGGMSSENAFLRFLLKNRHIGIRQFFQALFFIPRWMPKFKHHVFIKNKAYLTGLKPKKITQLAEEFVEKQLLQFIRPKLQEKIEEHREKGDILVLLTGSPSFLAKTFAKHLNISHVEATNCAQSEEYFLHLPPVQNPFSKEKLMIAKRLSKQYKIALEKCYAYGNSFNDRILLRAVGHPVAVTPSKYLRKIAIKEGFDIIG